MTSPTAPHPVRRRRTTRATRARILDAALRELGRNPDCSLGDIAEAAGVARRTVYTHFTGRAALVEGLAGEAAEAIRLAVADTYEATPHEATTHEASTHGARTSGGDASATGPGAPHPGPASALAHFVLTLWPVGDCYRTLMGLARQDLGSEQVSDLLAPARERVAGILAEGQRQGVFHGAVPPGPLSGAIEAHLLALLGTVNSGIWADDGTGAATAALIAAGVDSDTAAATAALIAAGVDSDTAAATVRQLHATDRIRPPHRPR
ncbi:TetR/AcrR family transcriptional regulator [Streptomyces sp. NBC_00299]|uniref:TetR/AcrR family transcriptional regulator n=1 Tax=Streptomyces sp. NBC_00299 TaxID=2975705 RepID=UPI002E2CE807|nr:TetR/AcrR family transcriptional regulator [Streptomyces sp. NBC_00299]